MDNRFKFRKWDVGTFMGDKPQFRYADVFTGLKLELANGSHPVEQCTGRNDKNGKLIYEKDIVKAEHLPEICVVVWSNEEVGFTLKSLKSNEYYSFYCYKDFEILGNIHENPELLEK